MRDTVVLGGKLYRIPHQNKRDSYGPIQPYANKVRWIKTDAHKRVPDHKKPSWENKIEKRQYLNIHSLSTFARILVWLLSETKVKREVFMMVSSFNTMYKKNGSLFLIQYLKEATRLTMKAISGNPEECKTFPRVATRRGLPLIIPGPLRIRIESKCVRSIQLVLSLLTVYRILKAPGELKLSTITDLFSGERKIFTKLELESALQRLGCFKAPKLADDAYLLPSIKAGPNFPIAALGASIDAYAFAKDPELLKNFEVISEQTGKELFKLLQSEIENLPN